MHRRLHDGLTPVCTPSSRSSAAGVVGAGCRWSVLASGDVTEDLVLPVPQTLAAQYAVPLAAPLAQPQTRLDRVLEGLADPLDELVDGLLATDRLVVAEHTAELLPPMTDDLLVLLGADAGQAARLRAATHWVLVEGHGRPGSAGHLWGAAAVAAGFAEQLGAPVLDLAGSDALTPGRLRQGLPGADGRVRLVDWVQILSSPGAGGLWFTTKGLRRFGLPELQTECVPASFGHAWGSVLNGVASVLARRWWSLLDDPGHEPAFVTLPAGLDVRGSDVARAHGHRTAPDVPADPAGRVGLRLDPEPDLRADSFLTVVPPPDHQGSATAFLAQVCGLVLGPAQRGGHVA